MRTALAFLLLCAGCVSHPPVKTPSRTVAAVPLPPVVTSRAEGRAVAPPVYKTNITLEWDDPEHFWPTFRLTEFHSTTNLLKPFAFKCYVPPGTNRVTFAETNAQEFFICRFVWTNVTPWLTSDWNVK